MTDPSSGTQAATPEQNRSTAVKSVAALFPDGYEKLDLVGQGGMGVVYRARDNRLDREVAIKLLQDRLDAADAYGQKFVEEARISAQLQHPGIPAIHEVGTMANGRPFLAMKLVKGETLEKLLAARPTTAADRGRFVAVFEAICQAVGYAHSRRVIHRDLKPANVMVGAFGEVQVMDWGLAKVLSADESHAATTVAIAETGTYIRSPRDSSADTRYGDFMGTPAYMPPEQALGAVNQISERSDVFGLGGILCAILTGHPPFAGRDAEAARQAAARGNLTQAFSRLDECGADADLIALTKRCLAVDPADRFPNASVVASEVAAFRASAEARARQAEIERRATEVRAEEERKRQAVELRLTNERVDAERRRRRLLLVAGGVLATVLTAGIVGTTIGLFEAREQRKNAQTEAGLKTKALEEEEKQRHLAEQRFAEKRQAMDQMLEQFGDKQLNSMPGTQEIRKVLFSRGVEQYEGMFRDNRDDEAVQKALTERYIELGRIHSELGSLEKALEPLKKAETVLRPAATSTTATPGDRFRLAVVLHEIGYSYWESRKSEEAIPVLREALSLLDALHSADATNGEYTLYRGMVQTRLGACLRLADPERARLYQAGYELLKPLAAAQPKNPKVLDAFARVSVNRAFDAGDSGKNAEAETLFEQAREASTKGVAIDPNDTRSVSIQRFSLLGLCDIYKKTNRMDKARELISQVIKEQTKHAQANPAVIVHQRVLSFAHDQYRKICQQMGEYEKAAESLQEMIRISELLAQRNPQDADAAGAIVEATQNLGDLYRTSKREIEAAAVFDRVLKRADTLMLQHPTSNYLLGGLLFMCHQRGVMANEVQQYAVSREQYLHGINLYQTYHKQIVNLTEYTRSKYMECYNSLVDLAKETGNATDHQRYCEEFLTNIKPDDFTNTDYQDRVLGQMITLSDIYEHQKDYPRALKYREDAHERAKKIVGGKPERNWYVNQRVIGAYYHLARVYRLVGDDKKEFQALRSHFAETEPYVQETDHTPLLKETAQFSAENLARLRETLSKVFNAKGMKRFTVPVKFEGVPFPFHIYVADSWKFLDDQFTWVREIRGGVVPNEVVDSFTRLYKIAKENKVSFQDLCVYALGTAAGAESKKGDVGTEVLVGTGTGSTTVDVNKTLRDRAKAKLAIQSGTAGPLAIKRLILDYLKSAEADIMSGNTGRAMYQLQDARDFLSLDPLGGLKEPTQRDIFSYYQFVEGALLATRGELEKGYTKSLNSYKTVPLDVPEEFAVTPGRREFALGAIAAKLKRPIEAVAWYHKSMDRGFPPAASRLYSVVQSNSECLSLLDADLREAYFAAKQKAFKDESPAVAFSRLIQEKKQLAFKQATLATSRTRLADYLLANVGKPETDAIRREIANRYARVGEDAADADALFEARIHHQKALELRLALAKTNPTAEREVALSYNRLGNVVIRSNRVDEAEGYYRKGLAINESRLATDPKDPVSRRDVYIGYNNLAYCATLRYDSAAAIAHYEKSLAVAMKAEKSKSTEEDLASIQKRLADVKARIANGTHREPAPPAREVP